MRGPVHCRVRRGKHHPCGDFKNATLGGGGDFKRACLLSLAVNLYDRGVEAAALRVRYDGPGGIQPRDVDAVASIDGKTVGELHRNLSNIPTRHAELHRLLDDDGFWCDRVGADERLFEDPQADVQAILKRQLARQLER